MRAALYVRVSTGEQAKKYGSDAQLSELEKYAAEHGYEIAGVYKDVTSGLNPNGECINKLLDDSLEKAFDVVLITEADRLTRDKMFRGYIKYTLEKRGIKIVAVNEPKEESEYAELMDSVISDFASFETKRRLRRVKRGVEEAKKRGSYMGRPPFGFKIVEEGGIKKLAPNEKFEILKDMLDDKNTILGLSEKYGMSTGSIHYIRNNPVYLQFARNPHPSERR